MSIAVLAFVIAFLVLVVIDQRREIDTLSRANSRMLDESRRIALSRQWDHDRKLRPRKKGYEQWLRRN